MWSTRVPRGKRTHQGGGDRHLPQEVGRANQKGKGKGKGKGRKKINILLTIDSLIHALDSFFCLFNDEKIISRCSYNLSVDVYKFDCMNLIFIQV